MDAHDQNDADAAEAQEAPPAAAESPSPAELAHDRDALAADEAAAEAMLLEAVAEVTAEEAEESVEVAAEAIAEAAILEVAAEAAAAEATAAEQSAGEAVVEAIVAEEVAEEAIADAAAATEAAAEAVVGAEIIEAAAEEAAAEAAAAEGIAIEAVTEAVIAEAVAEEIAAEAAEADALAEAAVEVAAEAESLAEAALDDPTVPEEVAAEAIVEAALAESVADEAIAEAVEAERIAAAAIEVAAEVEAEAAAAVVGAIEAEATAEELARIAESAEQLAAAAVVEAVAETVQAEAIAEVAAEEAVVAEAAVLDAAEAEATAEDLERIAAGAELIAAAALIEAVDETVQVEAAAEAAAGAEADAIAADAVLTEDEAAAFAAKAEIVQEAEGLRESTAWRQTSEALKALLERWRAAGSAGRARDQELWQRFSGARDAFYEQRNAAYAIRAKLGEEAAVKKTELIAEAERLLELSDPRKITDGLRDQMEAWKAAGHAGRGKDEQLWTRFNDARRRAATLRGELYAVRERAHKEAKQRKEELIAAAKELAALVDLEALDAALKEQMERWKEAGSAGRDSDERLWTAFREARDAAFTKLRSARRSEGARRETVRARVDDVVRTVQSATPTGEADKDEKRATRFEQDWQKSRGDGANDEAFAQALAAFRERAAEAAAERTRESDGRRDERLSRFIEQRDRLVKSVDRLTAHLEEAKARGDRDVPQLERKLDEERGRLAQAEQFLAFARAADSD